jgi:hypothetical protein
MYAPFPPFSLYHSLILSFLLIAFLMLACVLDFFPSFFPFFWTNGQQVLYHGFYEWTNEGRPMYHQLMLFIRFV